MVELVSVGKAVPRVDALQKVTGEAQFCSDMVLPNMLVGKALWSKYPSARILKVDTSRAERLIGVKAVITGKDMIAPIGGIIKDQFIVAVDVVRHLGEAVAAVAATAEEIAEEALELIEVEYEELPALFDPEAAMEPTSRLIHERINDYDHAPAFPPVKDSNICYHFRLRKGNVESAFKRAFLISEDRFAAPAAQPCPMEAHVAIASCDLSGKVTVWASTQSPYPGRQELADAFAIPPSKIRVIAPIVGGGFGAKTHMRSCEGMAVALARKTGGLPVKFAFSRKEEFISTVVKQPAIITLKTGVSRTGALVAREVKIVWDTGAYSDLGPVICRNAGYSAAGPYQTPHIKIDSYCVYTNSPVAGPFRGFGVPQTTWAFESQMDILAEKLGMDSLEFRLKNISKEGSISATGQRLYNVRLKETLEKVAQDIGWGKQAAGGARGKGIACMHRDTASPSTSSAFVKVEEDGTVTVLASGVEIGQGYFTVMAQMVAEVLGLRPDMITLASPDTEFTPFDDGTKSSRLTFSTGNAAVMAARDARGQICHTAAEILEANPADLEIREGKIFVKGSPEKGLTIAQISKAHLKGKGGPILGRGTFVPRDYTPFDPQTGRSEYPTPFWMYGAQAVEVKVDEETGKVEVLKVSACHDVGTVINPMTCEGQIEGSVVMGLGTSLWEQTILEAGKVLNANLADYKLCTALDVPSLYCSFPPSYHPGGPFGAKGVGEAAIVPIAPALANAIYDAVGLRLKDLPLTQEKLLKALKARRASGRESQ